MSAAGLGEGIADTSARMGTGAVSAAANAAGAASSAGAQAAQGAASAAVAQQSTAATAAASPTAATAAVPPAAVGGGDAAPMAVMPAAAAVPPAAVGGPAGGIPGESNVGPGVPGTPTAQPSPSAGPGLSSASSGGAGGGPAPVAWPMSPIRMIGADDDTGEALIAQAADAGAVVVEALIAQTRWIAGYVGIEWAVSLIEESSGQVSAWLASSEGPSYIPLQVRVPELVGLAVADPVVGRELWDMSMAAGGADPLEVLVRHAEMRCAAAPGMRMLALASSLPAGRLSDWANTVGARPVRVEAMTVDKSAADGMVLLHRCAVAMPWEWRQANAFTEENRLRVASRHMRMAALKGHLTAPPCTEVMDLFERGKSIPDELWAKVEGEWNSAIVQYQLAVQMIGRGGADDPELGFRKARAAEVVLCLHDYQTAEGCADLLYASRLAGAPLEPHEAVL